MTEKKLEKLEELYQKECALAEKHRKNARDIKEQIEEYRGEMVHRAINNLKLSEDDFKWFLSHLGDKKNIHQVIEELKKKKGGEDSQDEKESIQGH